MAIHLKLEKRLIDVSLAAANYFLDQCLGSYSGHMANVPYNPNLNSFCLAHSINTREDFITFLKGVIEQLEKEQLF